MSSRRKRHDLRLAHYPEYFSLVFATFLLRLAPTKSFRFLARVASLFWYYCFPFRKKVVLDNLALAFPDKSAAWRCGIARANMGHFARMALESADMQRAGGATVADMVVAAEGEENYRLAAANGAPFILVTGHFGNWELGVSHLVSHEKLKIAVLAKPLHNPLVEPLVAQARAKRGYDIIYTHTNLTRIVRAVRQNTSLGFLADQDARRSGIFVPFFGKPASTFQGPALFSYRLKLPILFGVCYRNPSDDSYHMRYMPPVFPNPEADREEEILRLTRAHVEALESVIREFPEQYFWYHRRWKTQPRKKRHDQLSVGPCGA